MSYKVTEEGNIATIHLDGEIDMDVTEKAKEVIFPHIDAGKEVHLNLSNVQYMDSSGISVLIESHQKALEKSTKENEKQFPNLVKFINELQSKEVHQTISKMINKDLSNSYVRVEVICDREGFWLKPHCDIKEKLMSGLIFINNANESEDLGPDFYNEKMEKVKTVPYKDNYGYMFTSGPNTWHGMEKKKVLKRKCLILQEIFRYIVFKCSVLSAKLKILK